MSGTFSTRRNEAGAGASTLRHSLDTLGAPSPLLSFPEADVVSSWDRSRLKLVYCVCVTLALIVAGVAAFTHNPFNQGPPDPPPDLQDEQEPPVDRTPYAPRTDDPDAPRPAVRGVCH